MAHRKSKTVSRERCKPSMALNAICPYYTMFPLSFLSLAKMLRGQFCAVWAASKPYSG